MAKSKTKAMKKDLENALTEDGGRKGMFAGLILLSLIGLVVWLVANHDSD